MEELHQRDSLGLRCFLDKEPGVPRMALERDRLPAQTRGLEKMEELHQRDSLGLRCHLYRDPGVLGMALERDRLPAQELQHKLRELHESGAAVQAGPLDFSLHDLNPGDKVYIKNFKRTGATQPSWEGPFQILLTTPTSIKIGERDS